MFGNFDSVDNFTDLFGVFIDVVNLRIVAKMAACAEATFGQGRGGEGLLRHQYVLGNGMGGDLCLNIW